MNSRKTKGRRCSEPGPILCSCSRCGAARFVGDWIYRKGRPAFLCEKCDPTMSTWGR
jgi:hypothetical protein